MRRSIVAVLTRSHVRLLPDLRQNITTTIRMTPDDFEHTLRSADGAAFGPEPLLTQSAWFRYHNRSPDVRGLYFVGAGTHPGAGIPGVLCSAKVLDRIVPAVPSVARDLPWTGQQADPPRATLASG